MTISLRDQLLGLGFKDAPKPDRPAKRHDERPKPQPHKAKTGQGGKPVHAHAANKPGNKPRPHQPRSREDIDLAKAYAIRAQKEKDERIAAEHLKQEEARQRREVKAKLLEFLAGKSLNATDADHVRHFEYGGKIKRIHVTAEQLKALNAGTLGVVQQDGRYLLVDADTLAQAEAIFAPAVALKVDPDAPAADDPYSDPQYQVPDDLTW